MLDFLFGAYTTPILIGIAILFVIWFIIKFPNGKIFIYTLVACAIFGSAIYSGINIVNYKNARGGIFGTIEDIDSPNYVIQNETTFEFQNIMMTQSTDGTYEARFQTDSVVKLSAEQKYKITVNNLPCKYVVHSNDYVVCEYQYNFYDEDFNSILSEPDTIQFKIAFYEKYTYLIVTSSGGSKAVDCWNDYFNKNDFILKIEASDSVYIPAADYKNVTLFVDDGITKKVDILTGYTFELPLIESPETRRFLGWSLDGENLLNIESMKITEDIIFYAIYEPTKFKVNFYNQKGTEIINIKFYDYALGENYLNYTVMPNDVCDETVAGEFIYWTTEQSNFVGIGDSYSNVIEIKTIDDLRTLYPDTQEFNLYPLIYSYY